MTYPTPAGRGKQLHFVVSDQEAELIRQRMEQAGVQNLSAYLRKAAIDGYIIQVDVSGIGELVSLLRRCSNNINQLAKQANAGSNIYEADIKALREQMHEVWSHANGILSGLAEIPL